MAYFGGGIDLMGAFTAEKLMYTITFMVAGFISILVHELGHALMMQKYGRFPQIILHGMGGVAISSGNEFTKKQNLLVTFMGPAAQILLGLIALGIYIAVGQENFPPGQSEHFVSSLYSVSLFWAVLNLIPIFPLDGGQILGALLGNRNRRKVHIFSIAVAGLIIGFLIVTGLAAVFMFGLIILGLLIFENVKALQN